MRRKRLITGATLLVAGYALASLAGGVMLCERAIRVQRRPVSADARMRAETLASDSGAALEHARILANDGAALCAWFIRPAGCNGDSVIVLHGQGDNRAGALSYAPFLLRHGYAVLLPDSRAHGESAGELATYGLLEAEDVRLWARWLAEQRRSREVFGLGISMGAVCLLQALDRCDQFSEVVVESPFASLREISYDRLGRAAGGGPLIGRTLLRPVAEAAFIYALLRYHLELEAATPAVSASRTKTPILLIHDEEDIEIPRRHAELIEVNAAGPLVIWDAPGAPHGGAHGTHRDEFERRVAEWFGRSPPRLGHKGRPRNP